MLHDLAAWTTAAWLACPTAASKDGLACCHKAVSCGSASCLPAAHRHEGYTFAVVLTPGTGRSAQDIKTQQPVDLAGPWSSRLPQYALRQRRITLSNMYDLAHA